MQIKADSPIDYIDQLPDDRKIAMNKLRQVILDNLPEGFSETMSYGMIGYVVPHSIYSSGYHCDPALPLPFMSVASQKHYIALYHSGVYANKELYNWFVKEYPKHCTGKLDMGKSCIRFKKMDDIPYDLIKQLVKKISVNEWIDIYEKKVKR